MTPNRQSSAPDGLASWSAVRGRFRRPWASAAMAVCAVAATILLVEFCASLRAGDALRVSLVAVAGTFPLLLAAVGIARLMGDGEGAVGSLGLRRPRTSDAVFGVLAGVSTRAVAEVIVPSTGDVRDPFTGGVATTVLVALLVGVLVSPFAEETLFRGVLQPALRAGMPSIAGRSVYAVVLTTGVFIVAHVSTEGLAMGTAVSAAAVGVASGTLAMVTGRLWGSITAHTTHNAIGAALVLW